MDMRHEDMHVAKPPAGDRDESQSSTRKVTIVASIAALVMLVAAGVLAYQANEDVRTTVQNMVAEVTPQETRVEVPSGTQLAVRLETTLTTKTSKVGDRFVATLAEPIVLNGATAVPAGAEISGHVILAEEPGKASGRGHLQLAYDELHYGGHSVDLNTVSQVYESESGTKKDAAIIGGGAVGGAIVGGVAGGSAGDAAKGAVIGGAAGTAASLMTRGPQLELAAGTILYVRLDERLEVVPAEAA